MSNEYGKKYPGSGGARRKPPSGGAPWHEMPEGMMEMVDVTEVVTEVKHPGLLGRIFGQRTREVEVERVVGQRIEKHYR